MVAGTIMCGKVTKEWFLDVPWGRLAMVSWGDPGKPPVLLVHGRSDTAATFIPLVNLLPDTYYYVGFDVPGHGRSDTIPGPPVSYLHFVDCIRFTVEHLQWSTFDCIAHSMGYLICSCYIAAFPGRITRLVNLDGTAFVGWHATTDQLEQWFEHYCARNYEKYYPPPEPATYTYDHAISMVAKSRLKAITTEQATVLASRCIESVGDGKYRFTWDPRIKKISTVLFPFDTLHAVLASNIPTLNIVTSDSDFISFIDLFKEYNAKMTMKLKNGKNYFTLNVEGGHDVHFTNPESVVGKIIEFLKQDFSEKCKL